MTVDLTHMPPGADEPGGDLVALIRVSCDRGECDRQTTGLADIEEDTHGDRRLVNLRLREPGWGTDGADDLCPNHYTEGGSDEPGHAHR